MVDRFLRWRYRFLVTANMSTAKIKRRILRITHTAVCNSIIPTMNGSDQIPLSALRSTKAASFIPSSAWQGPRNGYYFGTSSLGTGYYPDVTQSTLEPFRKRARVVQIAEDRNSTLLLEQAEQSTADQRVLTLTNDGVRRAGAALRNALERNQLARVQHAEDPASYMETEVALYEHIAAFKALAADPSLYPLVIPLLDTWCQLLVHDNTDIVSSAIAVLLEWIDASLLIGDDGQIVQPVLQLARAVLLQASDVLLASLTQGTDEQEPDDDDDEVGKGPEDILSLVENWLDMDLTLSSSADLTLTGDASSAAAYLARETSLVPWLLQQVAIKGRWQARALEILALLAPRQDVHDVIDNWSQVARHRANVIPEEGSSNNGSPTMDGLEILLQAVAEFRKRQPATNEELEVLENACMILTWALTFCAANVEAFLKAQGIELVVRCLKERVHAGGVALEWLDFIGSDGAYQRACQHVVEAGALKYLLPIFMGRHAPKLAPVAATSKKAKKEWTAKLESSVIRILYALTRHLTTDSPQDAQQRLLAKFVNDEKCDRLVELLLVYDAKARAAEYRFYRSDVEERLEDEQAIQLAALDAKLAGGGDLWHRLAALAAFVCVGSRRGHERILAQLRLQQSGIGLVREALQEFIENLDDGPQKQQLESYLPQI